MLHNLPPAFGEKRVSNMNFHDGLRMQFPVKELTEKLRVNKERHIEIVTEAKENYIVALQKELVGKLAKLKEGKKVQPDSDLPVPGDNVEEYTTAISMLEFTSDVQVVLTQKQYHCYVEDKWGWQKNFLDTASAYSTKAIDGNLAIYS